MKIFMTALGVVFLLLIYLMAQVVPLFGTLATLSLYFSPIHRAELEECSFLEVIGVFGFSVELNAFFFYLSRIYV